MFCTLGVATAWKDHGRNDVRPYSRRQHQSSEVDKHCVARLWSHSAPWLAECIPPLVANAPLPATIHGLLDISPWSRAIQDAVTCFRLFGSAVLCITSAAHQYHGRSCKHVIDSCMVTSCSTARARSAEIIAETNGNLDLPSSQV